MVPAAENLRRHDPWLHDSANPQAEVSAAECYLCQSNAVVDRQHRLLHAIDAFAIKLITHRETSAAEAAIGRELFRLLHPEEGE